MYAMTDLQKSIISYYDNTWLDYRLLWMNKQDRAIHFGYYDTFTESHTEALEKLNATMAQKAGITSSDKILDAGCGQGGSSFWLAEHLGCQTVGITLVPHQVQKALKYVAERKLQNKCSFYLKDYTETGFEDSSFDKIWACESLCHADHKIKFYKEAFRLLKPGGKIVVAEYIRKGRNLKPEDEKLLNHWCNGWSMPDLDTWEEHETNLKQSGFENIESHDITNNVAPSLSKLSKMSIKLLPLGRLLHWAGIRNQIKHGNQTASISQYEALTKKLWYYCILTACKPL